MELTGIVCFIDQNSLARLIVIIPSIVTQHYTVLPTATKMSFNKENLYIQSVEKLSEFLNAHFEKENVLHMQQL